MSISAFSPLPYVVLVEKYDENSGFHRHVIGKGKRIFIASSDNGEYSLIVHQNLKSSSLLKLI